MKTSRSLLTVVIIFALVVFFLAGCTEKSSDVPQAQKPVSGNDSKMESPKIGPNTLSDGHMKGLLHGK